MASGSQWLNQAANISINYIGSTAYIHVPANGSYNIYLNPKQTLGYNNQLHFNMYNWPVKFNKIMNWGIGANISWAFFSSVGSNNITYIGNGAILSQNQLWGLCALRNCPYAYGDIYFNVEYPSQYTAAGVSILGREETVRSNTQNFVPAALTGVFYSAPYPTWNMLTNARFGWINFHVHPDSLVNDYLYNYMVSSYRENENINAPSPGYDKITWTAMENGYYNSTFKIRVYYNNPHRIAFNNLNNISKAFFAGWDHYLIPPRIPNVAGLQPVCSDNVVNMSWAYGGWASSTGHAVCGNNVEDMSGAYASCLNLTGSPVCGPNVKNMSMAYWGCQFTGSPVCGNNVIDMNGAYAHCNKLAGSPVCGPNVQNMAEAYYNCYSLTGSPVCGNNVIDMTWTYYNCRKLTGSPVCGPNVRSMYQTYTGCNLLTGSPVIGENVVSLTDTYSGCDNLTGYAGPSLIPNVINTYSTFYNCRRLTTLTSIFYRARSMSGTYINCSGLQSSGSLLGLVAHDRYFTNTFQPYAYEIFSGVPSRQNVYVVRGREWDQYLFSRNNGRTPFVPFTGTNITSWEIIENGYKSGSIYVYNNFSPANNSSGIEYYGFNVMNYKNAAFIYNNTPGLTGSPVCGDIIENFAYTYNGCSYGVYNSTTHLYDGLFVGSPVCGNNVTNMYRTYGSCQYLTGSPVCGPNVLDMSYAYSGCSNLTGSPVFGPNVTSIAGAYNGCSNLTGNFVPLPNTVSTLSQVYAGCQKLTGTINTALPGVENGTYDHITNISHLFEGCQELTGYPWCGNQIVGFAGTYYNCRKLTGSPVCGPFVTSMDSTYSGCSNLTGNPVCGNNVIDMTGAYSGCSNLTGNPVCGPLVTRMGFAYNGCSNLTGSPVCGPNVNIMSNTYRNCSNLTGAPVFSSNANNINGSYYGCGKVTGTAYWNYNGYKLNNNYAVAGNTGNAFGGRNLKCPRVNLYVQNRTVFSYMYQMNNYSSLVGVYNNALWTQYSTNFFYNTLYNIYVYTGSSYPTNSYAVGITGNGTNCLLNGSATYSASSTTGTAQYNIALTADGTDWVVPNTTAASSLLTILGAEYDYTITDSTHATISLKNMAPAVKITAQGAIKRYNVTVVGDRLSVNGSSSYTGDIESGDTVTLTLTASGDYKLPATIDLADLNVVYTRTSDTNGTLVINPSGTSQTISRTVTAAIKRADLTYYPTNCTSASANPTQCTDANYSSLHLYFNFDGTNYKCPSEGTYANYVTVTGADFSWHRESDTSGYVVLEHLYTNNITISVSGVSTSTHVVTINATQDYGWYGLDVYDCVDGATTRNFITTILSGSETVEITTPYLYLLADTIYCQGVTGGVSQYNGSTSVYSVTGDGSVTVSYTTQCFIKGTEITMADGSRKPVEEIEYGDELRVWNLDMGNFDTAPVIWLTKKGLKNDHYYKLTFSDGTILCTTGKNSNHKVYNVDERFFKGVDKTQVGDRIFSENGIVTVVEKQYVEEEVEYYNLITSQQFNCFANGILTADRYGNMYEIDENMKFIKEDRPVRPLEEFTNAGIQEYWFKHFRLYESADSLESILSYIAKCESQMRKLPDGFDPTWRK